MLVERNFISPADRDKAQTTLDAARAQVQLTEAQVRNSEAVVRQREAQVAQARVDLGRTEIRSPVDGIVVKRSVEPGQTVAASLQAPELFVIARNLSDMQVETSIDEADVGRVQLGQKASFTVDAFPGRSFHGEVRQVRKAATVVSNVVTYTVIVSAANPDLTLLPGMTANVRIVTAQKEGVLKVANAALRFKPENDAAKVSRGETPGGERGPRNRGRAGSRVWTVDGSGKPQAIEVQTGITDGTATEVSGEGLAEGLEIIVGMSPTAKSGAPGGPRMF
jgi:HlyD family secretion protein